MSKLRTLDKENIPNVGDIFKNRKALCEKICIPCRTSGKGYAEDNKLMNRYFEFEKIPNTRKLVITKVHEYIVPDCDERESSTIEFKRIISDIIRHQTFMQRLEEGKFYSKTAMYCDVLSVFNKDILNLSFTDDEEKIKEFCNENNINSKHYFFDYISKCKHTLKSMIDMTSKYMCDNNIASCIETMHFIYDDGKGHVYTNEISDRIIEIEENILNEMKDKFLKLKTSNKSGRGLLYNVYGNSLYVKYYTKKKIESIASDEYCVSKLNDIILNMETKGTYKSFIYNSDKKCNLDNYYYVRSFDNISAKLLSQDDYNEKLVRLCEIISARTENTYLKNCKNVKFAKNIMHEVNNVYRLLFTCDFKTPQNIVTDILDDSFETENYFDGVLEENNNKSKVTKPKSNYKIFDGIYEGLGKEAKANEEQKRKIENEYTRDGKRRTKRIGTDELTRQILDSL